MKSYPIQYEQQRYRTRINDHTHRTSYQSSRERLVLTLNPNPHFSTFTFVSVLVGSSSCSYLLTSVKVRLPVHTLTKSDRNLSDHVMSNLQDRRGAVSLSYRNCTEITVLVNRSPTRYERRSKNERGVRKDLSPRVSPSRAPFFSELILLTKACYAGHAPRCISCKLLNQGGSLGILTKVQWSFSFVVVKGDVGTMKNQINCYS